MVVLWFLSHERTHVAHTPRAGVVSADGSGRFRIQWHNCSYQNSKRIVMISDRLFPISQRHRSWGHIPIPRHDWSQTHRPPPSSAAPFILSEGLPPVPAKLVAKIQEGDYVDMVELLRDNMEWECWQGTSDTSASKRGRLVGGLGT